MSSEQPVKEKMSPRRYLTLFLWTLKFQFRIAKGWFVLRVFTTVFERFRSLANAFLIANIVDSLVQQVGSAQADMSEIARIVALYFLISLGFDIINQIGNYADFRANLIMEPAQERAIAEHLYRLGIEQVDDPQLNNALTRVKREMGNMSMFVNTQIFIIAETIKLVTLVGLVFTILPVIGTVLIALALLQLIPASQFRKAGFDFQYRNTENSRMAWGKLYSISNLTFLPEVRILGLYKYLVAQFNSYQSMYQNFYVTNQSKWYVSDFLFTVAVSIVSAVGYLQLAAMAIAGAISAGSLLFWMRNVDTLYGSVTAVTNRLNQSLERSIRMYELVDFFAMESKHAAGSIHLPKLTTGPKIELQNLAFTYPNAEKPIYKNLNLTIEAGEKIAIVGENGAGKSTLVKLLAKFHQPNQGQILVNGEDLNDISADEWYKNIGVLLQDFQIYGQLSVRDNVYIGRSAKPLDEEKINEALRQADALNFVSEYKHGLDTLMSNNFTNGTKPSTGQAQKIAIARFFYRNAPLVIFDEPTAAIDAVSEANIFNRIYDFFTGKTVIIISHRFSTVRNADRILVVDKGEIVEQGSHAELMKLDGKYAYAFKLQAEGYQEKV